MLVTSSSPTRRLSLACNLSPSITLTATLDASPVRFGVVILTLLPVGIAVNLGMRRKVNPSAVSYTGPKSVSLFSLPGPAMEGGRYYSEVQAMDDHRAPPAVFIAR